MTTNEANEIHLIAASIIQKLWAMRAVSQLELLKWQVDASLEDAGKRIATAGIHAPVMHQHILRDLESMKGLCDRAIAAVKEAQKERVNHTDTGNPVAWRLVQKARELEGGE